MNEFVCLYMDLNGCLDRLSGYLCRAGSLRLES